MTYSDVFHTNNVKEWSDLCNKQDYDNIYILEYKDRNLLEEIYCTGRDLANHMSFKLEAFNRANDFPTLTSYIDSFSSGWLTEIDKLVDISQKAKEKCKELGSYPLAIKMMIVLFDKQIELLKSVQQTLDIMKTSDLYKIENGEFDMSSKETSHTTNITNISNVSGKVNFKSTDNSTNIELSKVDQVFSDIANAIEKSAIEPSEKENLHDLVADLQTSYTEGNYKTKYKEFIESVASHIGIISPFLPALSNLL